MWRYKVLGAYYYWRITQRRIKLDLGNPETGRYGYVTAAYLTRSPGTLYELPLSSVEEKVTGSETSSRRVTVGSICRQRAAQEQYEFHQNRKSHINPKLTQ